jgi:hypothetical protein
MILFTDFIYIVLIIILFIFSLYILNNKNKNSIEKTSFSNTKMNNMEIDDNYTSDEINQVTIQLLNNTQQHISNGDRDQALANLIHAIRITQGEEAIATILSEARRENERKLELQLQQQRETDRRALDTALKASKELAKAPSLLQERGDGSENILCDAFEDGSSVICKRCGGLVKSARWSDHCTLWCSEIDEELDCKLEDF